jgi:hypothetical protein
VDRLPGSFQMSVQHKSGQSAGHAPVNCIHAQKHRWVFLLDGERSKDNRVLLACSKNIGFHRSGNPMVIERMDGSPTGMVLSEFADIERPCKGFYQRHKSSDHKPSNCHHRQTFYDARDVV